MIVDRNAGHLRDNTQIAAAGRPACGKAGPGFSRIQRLRNLLRWIEIEGGRELGPGLAEPSCNALRQQPNEFALLDREVMMRVGLPNKAQRSLRSRFAILQLLLTPGAVR